MQEVLASFGMYSAYKWVWAGLAFMIGTYLLFGGAVCAAFAVTPVRPGEAGRKRNAVVWVVAWRQGTALVLVRHCMCSWTPTNNGADAPPAGTLP